MTTDPVRRPEVAAGMNAARERGVRLGRPPATAPPSGADRADVLRSEGLSLAAIAQALAEENVPTPSGKGTWTRSSVQYVLGRLDTQRAEREPNPSSSPPPEV
ncbi:recombinase family protein [Actinoplanes sp. CA-054009]